MDNLVNKKFDLYKDISERTGGEIYVGVIGPVRTGKSTLIKRIMDLLVLPNLLDGPEKVRIMDELPQSGSGKTITTTEPKFLPKDAYEIHLSDDVQMKFRLIDCVGYMIDGVVGHLEDNQPRMVKTPWSEEKIPFIKAAEIGTQKVMQDHSTIGISEIEPLFIKSVRIFSASSLKFNIVPLPFISRSIYFYHLTTNPFAQLILFYDLCVHDGLKTLTVPKVSIKINS